MKVAVLTSEGLDFSSPSRYKESARRLVESWGNPRLLVFPGFFPYWWIEKRGWMEDYPIHPLTKVYYNTDRWRHQVEEFKKIHGELARDLDCFLVGGTFPDWEQGEVFLKVPLWDSQGNFWGEQKQTHLNYYEKSLGISRGRDLFLFPVEDYTLGIISGSDSWHPEVGRILALKGANLVVAPGAFFQLSEKQGQMAGVWSQVQQNQFWAVESILPTCPKWHNHQGLSSIMGPCELTPGQTGYLGWVEEGKGIVSADLRESERRELLDYYPLLGLLNPLAYRQELPSLYKRG